MDSCSTRSNSIYRVPGDDMSEFADWEPNIWEEQDKIHREEVIARMASIFQPLNAVEDGNFKKAAEGLLYSLECRGLTVLVNQ